MRVLRALLTNHPLANITFAVVLLMGVLGYLQMPREQDPEINFNWVAITIALPGASAEDVEKLVTKPLEDAIKQVSDIKFVSSYSRESVASILIRFREVSERVFDKRVNDVRREIQNKKNAELPREAKEPVIIEVTTSNGFPTAMVLLAGEADDETLRFNARAIRDDIERIPGVDRVFASGLHEPELLVAFEPSKLASRGLTAADLADSVGGWFRDTFAGRLQAGDREWLVRVLGAEADAQLLAQVPVTSVRPGAATVPLEAVARAERIRVRPAQLVRYDDRPAVMLAITKKSYTNTLGLVERVNTYIDEKNKVLGGTGLKLVLADDQTIPTRTAIAIMESNAAIGLMTVLVICWVFLGTRVAILVALGIPFSLAGTFAILYAGGFTLNISVLLGVVIALGMLVDDAVVVVEAIYYRVQRGAKVLDASLDSLAEVVAPVTSSVATTLAAFLPLMLLPGILGKFMFVIPFVVTLALLISLVEAYWMLPAHVTALKLDLSNPSRMQQRRARFTHRLRLTYSKLLVHVMRRPVLYGVLGVLAAAGAIGAGAGGLIRVQFFAFDPIRLFYVNVDLPAGTPLDDTLDEVLRVERVVHKHLQPGEARTVTTYAGTRFSETEQLFGDTYGQIAVALKPRIGDMRDVPDIIDAMRKDVESFPGPGKKSFMPLSGGPPLTKPISIKVRADEYQELRAAADAMRRVVEAIPGSKDVTDDDTPGRPELVMKLDGDALRAAGLNAATAARLVRLHVEGEIVSVLRDKGEKVEVRVRGAGAKRERIDTLLADPIVLPGGATTTLGNLVNEKPQPGKGVIRHHNLRRSISVDGDLDKTLTDTVAANRIVRAEWEKIRKQFPNVDLDFSGELDDINESLESMALLFALGVGLIFLILAAQFRSYWQPFMILVTVPLAFTGVAYGLLVTQNPLSLYTLYGVIALTGIAVNSAIVLIDAANDRLRAGMSLIHATIYAARRRVVPIIITTTTTIGGLFSLAFGIGGKSLLWGPIAASIVWGLTFATLLTLFLIPLLYRVVMVRSYLLRARA
jgi:multidrug efflux pump subunit AcrB